MTTGPRLDDLAILSGRPRFAEPLHVGRPNIGDREALLRRINYILDRRWLTNDGPCVREFEARVAAVAGVRHAVAVCNATAGLEIAVKALDLRGEVIVPSFTFIATAHALSWCGITPVFCDIDPATHNLDPERAAALVTERTTGILGVHVWGRPSAIEPLTELAQKRKLRLLFDAAHAFGVEHAGRAVGSFGDAEVFSFHATKFVNAGEGGAVVTDNDDLAARLRLLRNFGISGLDTGAQLGINAKMAEVSAAMGLSSIDGMEGFIAVNRKNWRGYREALGGIDGIALIPYAPKERCNYQYVVLEIDERLTGLDRDTLVDVLRAENVLARRYFYPGAHRMEPYLTLQPNAGRTLPHTEALAGRVIVLPTGSDVGSKEIGAIASILRLAVTQAPELKARLRSAKPH